MTLHAGASRARDDAQRRKIVETAERLYREIGFQKTTVADIAREIHMSPGNVYRFFSAKSEINAAVAEQWIGEVESAAREIANMPGSAVDRLRALVRSNEAMNTARYTSERKIHDMVAVALDEQWPIIDQHIEHVEALLTGVIASGMENGEFVKGDAHLAARLVHTACMRFCHPRLMVEYAYRTEPTSAQMIEFCIAALRCRAGF
jgi:AcrR family transcriptional regulator